MPYNVWAAILLICPLLVQLIRSYRRGFPGHRLPPGPKRLPLIGNAHQLPATEYQEYTFRSWAQRYGDLIYAEFFGSRMVIVNSSKIARDLLDKRGAIYSSRPRMVTMVELIGWDPTLALAPYQSESRRKQRRWVQAAFGEKDTLRAYEALQQRETCIFLENLIQTPKDFILHITRFTATLILETVYGHRIKSLEDSYVLLMDRGVQATSATGPAGGGIMDFFPLLKHVPTWLPGAGFKRKALHARKLVQAAHNIPFDMVRKAVASGDARPSFTAALIEEAEKADRLDQDENDIRFAAGILYAAGSDTTKTMLQTFFLAMVLHPDVFKKVQEEVDHVVGNVRLPSLEDRPNLPYVDCVLKETYRAMTRNEEMYSDPDLFCPERFLTASGSPDTEIEDPRNIVFGYGRRLCPGRLFADTTLFLAIASIAATLDIDKARDAEGNVITPKAKFLSSFVSHPEAYECAMMPRSPTVAALVEEALENISASV
ncbi:cytochrome P450 monooxygenase [Rhodofomes roseus]|uniref:Cytochrome P450 monooxygenase n=1 Tax=Rhodofomes roseus TaxID=34475 RepID=A0ABQ8KC74_9APHY|nr:cytochrome P450 monooxygenase [Rhodofomes roseus]KAH9834581.1 cytochrome P450 monooxygenase [Rhodofomes roseus]